MTAKEQVGEFFKIYLVFIASALAVNVSLELVFGHPGWGIVGFYALFSVVGSVILLWKRLKPVLMGILSLAAGYICEITFMQPDFLQDIYALRISARLGVTLTITTLYWFLAWGVPAYVIHRAKPQFRAGDAEGKR